MVFILLAGAGCSPSASPATAAVETERPNLVLVILDDVGVDKIGAYHEFPAGAKAPCTPHLDALAARGLLFRNAWTNPLCSATRAQLLTGRHGFRTGVGGIIGNESEAPGLALSEVIVPELLSGYDSSAVGKWHLAPPTLAGLRHPLDSGFRYYAGSLFNIATPPIQGGPVIPGEPVDVLPDCTPGGKLGYHNWIKVAFDPVTHEPRQTCVTTYATTDTADDAIARARAMEAPWYLHVAFNAAHMPAEMPPERLCPPLESCGQPDLARSEERFEVVRAMIQALDAEIGRMLAAIRAQDPEAVIFVIGDNGTSPPGAEGEPNGCFGPLRSKGTLYQGGVRVPLIVVGPGIVPGECDALVSSTDLFATFADLAGVASGAQDSVSLLPYLRGQREPRRATVYAESFLPDFTSPPAPGAPAFEPKSHTRAVRNARYKLIRKTDGKGARDQFFDLVLDPCEATDLVAPRRDPEALSEEQRTNLEALQAELSELGVF